MRVPFTALILLLSDTVAFAPFAARRGSFLARSHGSADKDMPYSFALQGIKRPVFPTPLVTSTTPISPDLAKHRDIVEAGRKLVEIETAAETARGYLEYLAEVAAVIRNYLEDQSAPLRATIDVRERENTKEAKEYLLNIEKASASALTYLEHLENMATGIRTYLSMFEERHAAGMANSRSVQQANEAQSTLKDLEETAEAAKDYLKYLQSVAGVAQRYLEDSDLKGIQDFMPAEAQQLSGLKSIGDFMPTKENSQESGSLPRPTRVIGTHPKPAVVPPPAAPLEVDTTSGPRPVKRISPPAETIRTNMNVAEKAAVGSVTGHGNYLDSLRSPLSATPPKTVSNDKLDHLNSLASTPRASGVPKSGGASTQGYLDSIAPSMETNMVSGGYLDSISNPAFQRQPGSTPTSHFKESADSTPFSEAGPPGRGRSDVSHMDSMDTGTSVAAVAGTRNIGGAPPSEGYTVGMSPAATAGPSKPSSSSAVGTTSYLDSMTTTSARSGPTNASTSVSRKTAQTPGPYLDQLQSPTGASISSPSMTGSTTGSYLDQMSSVPSAPTLTGPSTASYLESMSSNTPHRSNAPASGSYLDQLSSLPAGASTYSSPSTVNDLETEATPAAVAPIASARTTTRTKAAAPAAGFHSDQSTSSIAIPDNKLRTSTPTKRKVASLAGKFSGQKKKLSQPEPVGWSRAISAKDTMSPGNLFLFMVEQYVLLMKGQLGYAKRVMLNCLNGAVAYGTWEEHVEKELRLTPAMKQSIVGMQGTATEIATTLIANNSKPQQTTVPRQTARVIGKSGSKPIASLLI